MVEEKETKRGGSRNNWISKVDAKKMNQGREKSWEKENSSEKCTDTEEPAIFLSEGKYGNLQKKKKKKGLRCGCNASW